jgi:hypothetical protein
MLRVFVFLVSVGARALRAICRRHADPVLEYLALRQQVTVLKKERPRMALADVIRNWGYYANASRGKRRGHSELVSPHDQEGPDLEEQDVDGWRRRRKLTWAKLIQKVYEIDPLICRFCRTEMKVVSFITEDRVIKKILTHIHYESQPPEPLAHSPPLFQDTVYVPF